MMPSRPTTKTGLCGPADCSAFFNNSKSFFSWAGWRNAASPSLNDADSLPDAREAVAHQWDFTAARPIGATKIDECYAGWGGLAEITWPGAGLKLQIHTDPPLDHLQLYTPPGRDFLGLEPVSNMPDAINRMDVESDNGLVILQPGEMLQGTIQLTVAIND